MRLTGLLYTVGEMICLKGVPVVGGADGGGGGGGKREAVQAIQSKCPAEAHGSFLWEYVDGTIRPKQYAHLCLDRCGVFPTSYFNFFGRFPSFLVFGWCNMWAQGQSRSEEPEPARCRTKAQAE